MKIIPDANIIIALVISFPYSEKAMLKMTEWETNNYEIIVPSLWSYEITSALRKFVVSGRISSATAIAHLQDILSLNIVQISPTLELNIHALNWAAKINQFVAYDASYLALADMENADFWTGDQRLFNSCQNLGLDWVHYIQDE